MKKVRLCILVIVEVTHYFLCNPFKGSQENLENTLEAFDFAIKKCKTDMIELDVRLTKDKKVVVFHDDNLTRQMGLKTKINDYNYEDLPKLFLDKFKLPYGNNNSDIIYNVNDGTNENLRYIPLLEELFKRYPDVLMSIDIKEYNLELIHEVNNLLKKYNREHNSVAYQT